MAPNIFPLEAEYAKDTSISPEDIAKFRQWLDTQPHLPGKYITDLDLVLTFHCCDRSTEVSKQVLDLHFTLRTLFHNLFKDRSHQDPKTLNGIDTVLFYPLPERTKEGYAVLYTHLVNSELKNFVFANCIRAALVVLDSWQQLEGTWPGFVLAIDMKGVTISHLTRLDIQTLQQFFYYLQEAMLVKLKCFHFMSAPSWMDRLMSLIRPFMKKSLQDMVQIHTSGPAAVLPAKTLPKEVGGEGGSIKECQERVHAMLLSCSDYLRDENLKRVDETRRPGKPKTISDIFGGVEGSFKKLDID